MGSRIRNYSDLSSLDSIAANYGHGRRLDAKQDVMRRFRTSPITFEDWLLARLPINDGMRVLDIGAGSGRFAIPLARRLKSAGGMVVAADVFSDVMTPIREVANREPLPVTTVVAEASRLPADLGGFDLILAAHMLYHLPDFSAGVRALREKMAVGGMFVATTNSADGMPELMSLHAATLHALDIPSDYVPPPKSLFTKENGADMLGGMFADVRLELFDSGFTAPSAEPLLTYYAASEMYANLMRNESLPLETRLLIAPVFARLAQEVIDEAGQPLLVRKEVCAFICR